MALGKNIEHLRKLQGLPRSAVAKGIGIDDDQALYQLEKRDSTRSDFGPKLAEFFNVDYATLVTRDFTGMDLDEIHQMAPRVKGARLAAVQPEDDSIPSHVIVEVISLFAASTPAGRQIVLDTLRAVDKRIPLSAANDKL